MESIGGSCRESQGERVWERDTLMQGEPVD